MHRSHFHASSQNAEVRPALQKSRRRGHTRVPNSKRWGHTRVSNPKRRSQPRVSNSKRRGSTPAFQKQDYDAYLHKGPTWQIPSTKMPSKQVQRTTPLRQGINSSKIRVKIQSIPKIRLSQPQTFENFGGGSVGCLKIPIDSLSPIKHWWWKLQSDDFQNAII